MGQLLKVPVLVEHFREHNAENSTMSLWDFMVIHYASKRVIDDDYEKDMKLPFKVIDNLSGSTFFWAATEACLLPAFVKAPDVSAIVPVSYDLLIDLDFFSGIWQPPQIC